MDIMYIVTSFHSLRFIIRSRVRTENTTATNWKIYKRIYSLFSTVLNHIGNIASEAFNVTDEELQGGVILPIILISITMTWTIHLLGC